MVIPLSIDITSWIATFLEPLTKNKKTNKINTYMATNNTLHDITNTFSTPPPEYHFTLHFYGHSP